MRPTILSRRLAAVAIAAVAVFGLTACTGSTASSGSETPAASAPANGQTTEDACRLVTDTITSATDEFEQATEEDPAAVADAFHAAAQSIADASSQVTNEEVAAVLPSLQQLFEDVADLLPAIIEGDTSKAAEFEQMGADLQAAMQEFDALCGSAE